MRVLVLTMAVLLLGAVQGRAEDGELTLKTASPPEKNTAGEALAESFSLERATHQDIR